MKWLAVALFLAAPFWETKAPADWSERELISLLTDSPWAQMVGAADAGKAPPVQIYLATAAPMEQAEAERDRRYKRKHPNETPGEMTLEYQEWLKENRANSIVLAIAIPNLLADNVAQDSERMQQECVMEIGRKKIKMTGDFPPTAGDPYLRLAFPRAVTAKDKRVTFELYLPGVPLPYRTVEFNVRDMMLNGKLEM